MPSRDLIDTAAAFAPIEAAPGVLVHSRRDREVASETWLLLAARDRQQARRDWESHGVALLRCGALFSVVRMPAAFVHEAAGTTDRVEVSAFLADFLDGGPIFFDGGGRQFYALTPGSTARRWRIAGTECLGPDTFLGVPATGISEPDPRCAAYWSVPMDGPGTLCLPARVARLVVHGRALVEKKEADEDG